MDWPCASPGFACASGPVPEMMAGTARGGMAGLFDNRRELPIEIRSHGRPPLANDLPSNWKNESCTRTPSASERERPH